MFSQMNQFLGGIEWGTSIWFKFGIWNKWWLLQIFVWILLISSDWGPLCPMIFPILLVVNKKLVKIARFNLQVSQNHLLPLPRPQFQPIKFAMCPLILQKCLAQQASFFLPTQTFSPTFSHSFPNFWYGYGSIPIDTFLVGWTSIYQLFWGSLGTRVLTHPHMSTYLNIPLLVPRGSAVGCWTSSSVRSTRTPRWCCWRRWATTSQS